MTARHADLAAGRWGQLTLAQQLGNVGSEISRASRWKDKDAKLFDGAMIRALELLDLSIRDPRWRKRLKELTRARELLCDAWSGGREYRSDFDGLNRYFFRFALVARR
ncbi:MAG: hypothetical protein HY549_07490 [Elusimicrobia bacterium]|nr:hypothetical protein [Elusimicrobiota bacterium]